MCAIFGFGVSFFHFLCADYKTISSSPSLNSKATIGEYMLGFFTLKGKRNEKAGKHGFCHTEKKAVSRPTRHSVINN